MILYDCQINFDLIKKLTEYNPEKVLKYLPDIRDVSLSGKLIDKNTREPIKGKDIYLSVLFNNPQLHVYKTNYEGDFIFH